MRQGTKSQDLPIQVSLNYWLTKNYRLILTYLIPCHLLTTHTLPTAKLLEPYPRLQKQFLPLSQCIRKGELHKFDLALQQGEDEFVKRRIYLTLERGRDIALRNLLRKVFIAGGFEEPKDPGAKPLRRTRIPIDEFVAAIRIGSQEDTLDTDEVECFLANMMYKVSNSFYQSPSYSSSTILCSSSPWEMGIKTLGTTTRGWSLHMPLCLPRSRCGTSHLYPGQILIRSHVVS